jgi:methyl-accepting chemotaxis protein
MATTSSSFLGSIRGRLIAGIAALALIPLILLALALGYYASRQSASALDQRAYDQMASIRAGKQEEIKAYFDNIADLMRTVSNTAEVRQALREGTATQPGMAANMDLDQAKTALTAYYRNDFARQFSTRNPGQSADISEIVAKLPAQTIAAQYAYIAKNPNPLGKKNQLAQSDDGSAYSAMHPRIHAYASRAVEDYGLYDFFLVDAQTGFVVYTYFKELDFATSLRDGPWAQSGLGQAFEKAMSAKNANDVSITDYAPYRPSYDDQASFVSAPIVEDGRTIGVFIAQLPIERVNQIMTFNDKWKDVGLGESGETYLVGADKTPRSVSRFMKENSAGFITMMRGLNLPQNKLASMDTRDSNIGLMAIDTRGVQNALAGQSGTAVYPDYRGINVLGSYAPIDVLGLRWVILSEIDESESNAPIATLQRGIAIAGLGTLLLVGIIAMFAGLRLARSINVPLAQVQDTVQKVGGGDLAARTGLQSNDEIGQLAKAFDGMLDDKVAELARAQKENEGLNSSVIEIMMSVAQLAQRDLNVKVPVSENVTGAVSDAINMMTNSTSSALQRVNQISKHVSESSERVKTRSDEVQNLANDSGIQANAASQELVSTAAAMREMGEQAQTAGREAEQALTASGDALKIVRETIIGINESRLQIEETEARMKRLADISRQVSTAVTIIEEIADRTSVLALTASMQAVAAGESGRGFAVVADEVKRLAENAHTSTQQIAGLVSSIQKETAETLSALSATATKAADMTRLADRAGTQMDGTRQATQALVASVRRIEQTTQAQGEASQRLLARAQQLIGASKRTLSEIELQREDTESLSRSATDLVNTVSEFKLPT